LRGEARWVVRRTHPTMEATDYGNADQ